MKNRIKLSLGNNYGILHIFSLPCFGNEKKERKKGKNHTKTLGKD